MNEENIYKKNIEKRPDIEEVIFFNWTFDYNHSFGINKEVIQYD